MLAILFAKKDMLEYFVRLVILMEKFGETDMLIQIVMIVLNAKIKALII